MDTMFLTGAVGGAALVIAVYVAAKVMGWIAPKTATHLDDEVAAWLESAVDDPAKLAKIADLIKALAAKVP